MVNFKSIAVLDLETTGLPWKEHNYTKITEISVCACLKSHCENGLMPRVVNKLVMGLNPYKIIALEATEKTGLYNELLEEYQPFNDNLVSILNNFLERLPQPVCLIAHNGNRFDFPILKKMLTKYKEKFTSRVYCADSFVAFKKILPKPSKRVKSDEESSNLGSQETQLSFPPSIYSEVIVSQKNIDQKTPKIGTVSCNITPVKSERQGSRTKNFSKVCRKLDFDSAMDNSIETNNCLLQSQSMSSNGKGNKNLNRNNIKNQKILNSYKLEDIYIFLHDNCDVQNLSFHKSEDDCIALLSCIIKCHKTFLLWMDENAVPFDEVKPLF